MSVGSQELDRAALERKDRGELVTISEALGEKPPARARKGDIVDLILRLTGAVDAGEAGQDADTTANGKQAGGEAPAESSQGGEPPAGAEAPPAEAAKDHEAANRDDAKAEAPAAEDDQAPRASETKAEEAKAGEADEADDGETRTEAPPDQERQARQNGQDRGQADKQQERRQGDGQQAGNRQQQGRDRPQEQNRQGDRNQQQNRQGDRNQQAGYRVEVEAEPGNRRRRRRGRGGDRERGPSEEVFQGEPVAVSGTLDLRDEGYGFLRLKGFLPSKDDVYVSVKQVRQFGLRKGDIVDGASRPATRSEKNPALLRIDKVNGKTPDEARKRPKFEDLTPLFPDERLKMETEDDPTNMTARIIDLISPIGKGQRALIVSPPKAGKTTVMKQICRSIETNNPEVKLIVALVDERPEEVTDFRRWLIRGEVVASTFDRPSDEHTSVTELVIERAKRLVEEGEDVVIVLDGITRLARAYNLAAPATGRIMSGGIDTGALYPPKRFFGAARNAEEGGSLTILATALVETGSKMDEVIFEEFKATGNMELKLDRRLAERRIYPAIDVDASSTRHEELLFERKQLQQAWRLRRVLSGLAGEGGSAAAGLEMLIDRLKTFKTNDEFLAEVAKAPGMV